ncbi:GerAB/ArcD/ProY family transporter [Paenibacillus kobensis]|uniref:GerAB/ArcD/ProY family transporter n=1 Tax=Paenibacillus kobensis TaxID=59841 RepID=UPI000FD73376|nr:endospore germination permease [Paenibacillus kobensis]
MKPAISTLQTVAIINNAISPTAILSIPPVVISIASHDAWISVLGAGLAYLPMVAVIAAICRANPGKPFIEWLESRFGRPVGMLIGLLFGVYYFNTFCLIVRQFANFIGDMVLDETPLFMLIGIMVAVAAFTVAHGVEAIARSSFIVLLMVAAIIPFSVLLNYSDINLQRLLPLVDTDLPHIAAATVSPFLWLTEMSILLIFSPYMKRPASFVRAGMFGMLFSLFEIMLVVVMTLTIFGPRIVPMMSYPFINMVGIVEVGKFLERIEIFTVSAWGMTMYIKMAVFLFAAVHCLSQTLHLRSNRHALIGLSVLAVVTTLAAWPRNVEMDNWVLYDTIPFLIVFNVGLPAVIGIGLILTRAGNRAKGAKTS